MGYFSSGTEGLDYAEENCLSCVHHENCAVWLAHNIHNYSECNNAESILHLLIPYENGVNGECLMRFEV